MIFFVMYKTFKEYNKFNLNQWAYEIDNFWKKNNIFEKSITTRYGRNVYVFYEGPPSANGYPGIHHVMVRTIKDVFCRYHTLKGEKVDRKSGWDAHGLPIELSVEKELNLTKEDIGQKISVEEYNKTCLIYVMRYTRIWKKFTDKIGYWIDHKTPYMTYHSKYIESLWWILKQFYKKKLLYKGYTVQPYSPAAGTGLSTHELNLPGTYKEITDTTIVVQFQAIKESLPTFLKVLTRNVYFLAWTTTPWTLPSNTALTICPDIEYLVIDTFNSYSFERMYVILAKVLISKILYDKYFPVSDNVSLEVFQKGDNKIPYKIINTFSGKRIVGSRYVQLLPWVIPYERKKNAFKVISGDFVTTETGTGLVHIAPTFGVDDAEVAKKNEIPPMLVWDSVKKQAIPLVDVQGRFIQRLPKPFAGKYVRKEYYNPEKSTEFSVDVELSALLQREGKVFKIEKYQHYYPHCWRTDKPILYYPLDTWCIKTTAAKYDMISLNQNIHWVPTSTGTSRFNHWLENLNDWNLSRTRYWGVPLPIWRTHKEERIIGSFEELRVEIEKSIKAGFMKENPLKDFVPGDMSNENYQKVDVHKPFVDDIILVSTRGTPMRRESDLIDVWFDSGAMPFAQWHYPFENTEKIDKGKFYPANFIAEGVDQTRGWFYTLHAISSMLFKSGAYKNVVAIGLVLDKNGHKMSKSKGNTVNPFEVLDLYGPDATRWYMLSKVQPWENLKFEISGIDEVRRKFFGTIYNTYAFFAMYANIDGFCYKENFLPIEERPEMDRWILSELHQLINKVEIYYDTYNTTRATRIIYQFVIDDLSNWYIRICRRRFWKEKYSKDKVSAYQTLYDCLLTISIMSSPIAPFFSEKLYMNLVYTTKKDFFESVHLAYFPKYDEKIIDKRLKKCMHLAQRVTSIVLSFRKKKNIKVRQPLRKLIIFVSSFEKDIFSLSDIIKQEVNVKEIQFLNHKASSKFLIREIKPNFNMLGPRFGKRTRIISDILKKFTQQQIDHMEKYGHSIIEIEGIKEKITIKEVNIGIKTSKNWLIASDKEITVVLDLEIDNVLRSEGIARELINRIQNLRKKKELGITDKIILSIAASPELEKVIKLHREYICEETLSVSLSLDYNLGDMVYFEGETIRIFVQKLA